MDSVAQENKILKKTLQDLLDIDQGIYPKAVVTDEKHKGYKKRTEYMNGWNDALMENMEKFCDVLEKNGVEVYDDGVVVYTKE